MLTKKRIPLERRLANALQRERAAKARLVDVRLALAQLKTEHERELAAATGRLHAWVPRDPRDPRQTDIRVLAVLQTCLDLGPPCSIAAVARRMQVSKATAWEWVQGAHDAGWLEVGRMGKSARLTFTAAALQRIPALRTTTKETP